MPEDVSVVYLTSPATALEKELDGVDHTFAGEPQEEGMVQRSSSFLLITKPRLLNPVGLRDGLARCQSTLSLID